MSESVPDGSSRRRDLMIGGVDIREVGGCTCLRLRRSARMTTQLYDAHLGPVGLTIGQFGILAQLYGIGIRREAISIKELAALIGMDPTTLTRTLKPLEHAGFVRDHDDPKDRRARLLSLTRTGVERLARATPLWDAAQRELRKRVGAETSLALNGLLDLAGRKLSD